MKNINNLKNNIQGKNKDKIKFGNSNYTGDEIGVYNIDDIYVFDCEKLPICFEPSSDKINIDRYYILIYNEHTKTNCNEEITSEKVYLYSTLHDEYFYHEIGRISGCLFKKDDKYKYIAEVKENINLFKLKDFININDFNVNIIGDFGTGVQLEEISRYINGKFKLRKVRKRIINYKF